MQLFLQALVAGLGWLLDKATFGWLMYRAGKWHVRQRQDAAALKARAAQLEAAIDTPKGRDELVDRVRKSGL
jgi:hypothetical protein